MTDGTSPLAEWYNEGSPIPVVHPIPEVSATINFPEEGVIEWKTHNHETGKQTAERFELVDSE